MGRTSAWSRPISKSSRPHGPQSDPRFALHQRQPRADKLDARQRKICHADPAFSEVLEKRVRDPRRFAAFLAGMASYVRLGDPCSRCGGFRRRTRDRSCYTCHLNRGRENFERMKAALSPHKQRNLDSHLDLLARQKAERDGEHMAREFGRIAVKRFPTGRLEVIFPDGFVEPDLSKRDGRDVWRLMEMLPELKDALVWAGWF
jgi:hypothetical protein